MHIHKNFHIRVWQIDVNDKISVRTFVPCKTHITIDVYILSNKISETRIGQCVTMNPKFFVRHHINKYLH